MAHDFLDLSDRRLIPARSDLADLRLRGLVEAERYVVGEPHRVVAPHAPLRRVPNVDAGIDTEVVMGDLVSVYEDKDGFAFAQLQQDGYVGYLPSDALGLVGPNPTHRVTAVRTFLYPAPDLKRPAIGYLGLGATFVVEETVGAYGRLASGAYVFLGHCSDVDTVTPDFAATAEQLLGAPYLWGGRTSLGLDCSGLVQLALVMAGISAPRDADQQERALGDALPVSLDGLRRGDLVFWRGHVGLMRDETALIHANGHHMAVAAEPLSEAVTRIAETSFGAVTSIRRISSSAVS